MWKWEKKNKEKKMRKKQRKIKEEKLNFMKNQHSFGHGHTYRSTQYNTRLVGKLFEDFSAFRKKKNRKKLSNFSMYIIAHGKVWFLYKDSFFISFFFACLLSSFLCMLLFCCCLRMNWGGLVGEKHKGSNISME